jgi:uncharacterized damage-inducible protein DinB
VPTASDQITQWASLGAAGALLVGLLRLTQRYVGVITGGALDRAKTLEAKVSDLERAIDALRQSLADERERCESRLRELERTLNSYKGDSP